MDYGIRGKVAVVTGGTRGIGRAITQALFEEGCQTAVLARNAPDQEYPDGMRWFQWDATQYGTYRDALDQVEDLWGSVDILCANVGGGGRWGTPEHLNRDDWETIERRNLGAMVGTMDCVLPGMIEQEWGRVVTIASIYGREAGARPWFAAAKASEIAAMKAYSQVKEFVQAGITFNTVCPGCVQIPGTGWEPGSSETVAKAKSLPMGRLGKPHEVACLVTFLCSDKAAWINGSCITIDGGESKAF